MTQLADIAAALRAGAWLPPDDATRAADALDLVVRDGDERTAGQRPDTVVALVERARLLQNAAVHFYPGRSASAQADALADALGRYASTAWQRERTLDTCPARHLGTVWATCWRVLRLHDRVLSARQIRRYVGHSGA